VEFDPLFPSNPFFRIERAATPCAIRRARYWVALSTASIFGCDTGDAFASQFGFVSGLALLAAVLAAIVYFERQDPNPRQTYYLLAIVVVRTAATNLADFTAFRIGIAPGIGALTMLLLAMLVYARVPLKLPSTKAPGRIELPALLRVDAAHQGVRRELITRSWEDLLAVAQFHMRRAMSFSSVPIALA